MLLPMSSTEDIAIDDLEYLLDYSEADESDKEE
jgi:hypothetical protein